MSRKKTITFGVTESLVLVTFQGLLQQMRAMKGGESKTLTVTTMKGPLKTMTISSGIIPEDWQNQLPPPPQGHEWDITRRGCVFVITTKEPRKKLK